MKITMGIITLLAMYQVAFAETPSTNIADTQIVESDVPAETLATMPTTAPVAMKEQSGFSRGSVVRSAFTRDIAEREPTENLQNLTNENGHVKFFTELRDMNGQTAIHRWEYEGKVVAEVEFNVKGPRWRVWSSKSFVPQWTGDWKVSVVNGVGEVISEKSLSYDIAAAPISMPAAESTTKEMPTTDTMQ